jgi:hypothetical protein
MVATHETPLVAAIAREIKKRYPGCWVFKVVGSPFQMTGVPDLLLTIEGHTYGFEVKYQRPGESVQHARGRATPGQLKQIKDLRRAGATADVILSAAEAIAVIEHTGSADPVCYVRTTGHDEIKEND